MLSDEELQRLVYRAVKITNGGISGDYGSRSPVIAAVFTALVDEARLEAEADIGESQE